MLKKILEMNEKVKNNINRFKKGVPEIDNLLDVIYEMELDQDDEDFVLYHKYEALVSNFAKKQFLPLKEFAELTSIITNNSINNFLFLDFYKNNVREIHDIIINKLKENPKTKINERFLNHIYHRLFSNYRSMALHRMYLSQDDLEKDVLKKIQLFHIEHDHEIDTAHVYEPPEELQKLINQLSTEKKKEYLDICHRSDYFKWGPENKITDYLKNKMEELKKKSNVQMELYSIYKDYYHFTDCQELIKLGLLLKGDSFWDYAIENYSMIFDKLAHNSYELWELELEFFK